MPQAPVNPIQTLKDYGLATRTIAGIAHVNVFTLRSRNWDELPENDPALILIRNAVAMMDALERAVPDIDPAAFYEEHFVVMDKNGVRFYCLASRLYEVGIWTAQNFIDYAAKAVFYSRYDLAEEFPITDEVVDASDGYKAIVCKRSVLSIDTRTLSSLDDYTIIK